MFDNKSSCGSKKMLPCVWVTGNKKITIGGLVAMSVTSFGKACIVHTFNFAYMEIYNFVVLQMSKIESVNIHVFPNLASH